MISHAVLADELMATRSDLRELIVALQAMKVFAVEPKAPNLRRYHAAKFAAITRLGSDPLAVDPPVPDGATP